MCFLWKGKLLGSTRSTRCESVPHSVRAGTGRGRGNRDPLVTQSVMVAARRAAHGTDVVLEASRSGNRAFSNIGF